MSKQLPSSIWTIAWLLAFIAGCVNIVGLLGFQHQALTHMTGLTSRLALGVVEGQLDEVVAVSAVMIAFLCGGALSGLVVNDAALRWGADFSIALLIEAVLLSIAALLLHRGLSMGFSVAAVGAGLQNAMISSYSGSTIRTTHVSGMFTDLGISVGHSLRRRPVNRLRLRICLSTISGFASGGVVGVWLFHQCGTNTMLLPAVLAGLMGLGLRRFRPR